MQRLLADRYVDDDRFCRFFVRDKMRFCGWGRRKIEQALHLKGVSADIAAARLDEVSAAQWTEILRPLIAAKRRSVKAQSDYELRAKLMRFAMSRGFTMDVVQECVDADDFPDM